MAEQNDNTNNQNITPPANQNQPPDQQTPAQQRPIYVNAPTADQGALQAIQSGLSNVATALAALPENIVSGLRESNQVADQPPAQQQQQQQSQTVGDAVKNNQDAKTVARRGPNRFAKWFLGIDQ